MGLCFGFYSIQSSEIPVNKYCFLSELSFSVLCSLGSSHRGIQLVLYSSSRQSFPSEVASAAEQVYVGKAGNNEPLQEVATLQTVQQIHSSKELILLCSSLPLLKSDGHFFQIENRHHASVFSSILMRLVTQHDTICFNKELQTGIGTTELSSLNKRAIYLLLT